MSYVYQAIEGFAFEWERSENKERFINYDVSSMAQDCKQLDDLVSKLYDECKLSKLVQASGVKTIHNAEMRLKNDLKSILWNLFRAQRHARDCYLRISLSTHSFMPRSQGNPFGISRYVPKIVRLLEDARMINLCIGFDDRKSGVSRFTRFRASLDLIKCLRFLPKEISVLYVEKPSIEFRCDLKIGAKKTSKPFNSQKFDEVENIVRHQNMLLSTRSITLGSSGREFLEWKDKKGNSHISDLTKKSITAIFHVNPDNSVCYGRMHGGFWQNIPSAYRKHIYIDGMPTVELDYSAQILSMAASHSKRQIDGDLYDIDLGLEILGSNVQRSVVKFCIVIMLNSNSMKSALAAVRKKISDEKILAGSGVTLTNLTIEAFYRIIILHYPFLRKYAFNGLGKMFFYHDSEIARSILKAFIALNKVVLPIHDGFIVAEEDGELLHRTMSDAWSEKFGTNIYIKKE